MKIAFVTHCYASELPQFAYTLRYQLDTLWSGPGSCQVRAVVCYLDGDPFTTTTLMMFRGLSDLIPLSFTDVNSLGRRSIGRNRATKEALDGMDLVVFTDADYVWSHVAVNALGNMPWPDGATMIFPKEIQISKTHAIGDEQWQRAARTGPLRLFADEFVPKSFNRAIGGVQIVKGDFARQYGYLDGDVKWQSPRTDGKPFADFKDDVAYRRFCLTHGNIVGVDIPGILRIRHSKTTYQEDIK